MVVLAGLFLRHDRARRANGAILHAVCLAMILAALAPLSSAYGSELGVTYLLEWSPPDGPLQSSDGTVTEAAEARLSRSGSISGHAGYEAEVTYGSILASSSAAAGGDGGYGSSAGGTSHPYWTDELTITADGVASGTAGTITLSYLFRVDTISSSQSVGAQAGANYDVGVGVGTHSYVRSGGAYGGDTIEDFSTPTFSFIFGTPFVFSTNMGAYCGVSANALSSGSAEITNLELILAGIYVIAENEHGDGQFVVTDPTIDAVSGTDYPVTVPEPMSVAMLLGLAPTMLFRRRGRPTAFRRRRPGK